MNFYQYAEKLETIKYIAVHKYAGTPKQLAQKLNVSERTVQRMAQQLREHGYPIIFNRMRNCYELKDSLKKDSD